MLTQGVSLRGSSQGFKRENRPGEGRGLTCCLFPSGSPHIISSELPQRGDLCSRSCSIREDISSCPSSGGRRRGNWTICSRIPPETVPLCRKTEPERTCKPEKPLMLQISSLTPPIPDVVSAIKREVLDVEWPLDSCYT